MQSQEILEKSDLFSIHPAIFGTWPNLLSGECSAQEVFPKYRLLFINWRWARVSDFQILVDLKMIDKWWVALNEHHFSCSKTTLTTRDTFAIPVWLWTIHSCTNVRSSLKPHCLSPICRLQLPKGTQRLFPKNNSSVELCLFTSKGCRSSWYLSLANWLHKLSQVQPLDSPPPRLCLFCSLVLITGPTVQASQFLTMVINGSAGDVGSFENNFLSE